MAYKKYNQLDLQESIDSIIKLSNDKITEYKDAVYLEAIDSLVNLYILNAAKNRNIKEELENCLEELDKKKLVPDLFNKHLYTKQYFVSFDDIVNASKFIAACMIYTDKSLKTVVNNSDIRIYYEESCLFEIYPDMQKDFEKIGAKIKGSSEGDKS